MTTNFQNLLIEIGTEELPPKSLKNLASSFSEGLLKLLSDANLPFEEANSGAQLSWFASPRRIAVKVTQIAFKQSDESVTKLGPALKIARDADGNPTKAAQGWARGMGITVDEASEQDGKLAYTLEVKGKALSEVLPALVETALKKLPIPKPMRWGSSDTQFIRPIHTVTMLFGDEVIPGTVMSVTASNKTQGHRFHSPGLHTIEHADTYIDTLKSRKVMVDFHARRAAIESQLADECKKLNATFEQDDDLLDEVTALVEWPVALVGSFEEKFLDVPQEALIYSMKDNQKYFPLQDSEGKLLNKFVFVSNIESKDPAQVIAGNEKVVRPRLADAEFFYETDKKHSLESRLPSLETVLFQKQLGTLREKSSRISSLAGHIAELIGADKTHATRAGLLSKTDLMSEMVMEFTDIQGVMGRYYALNDGENIEVADALYQQYLPRFAGDSLPTSDVACAVSLADKFDTLVGIFGIGQAPKGDKDPFALRRAAIGALRILIEKSLLVDVNELAQKAAETFEGKLTNDNVVKDVTNFLFDRYHAFYKVQGLSFDTVESVLARKPVVPFDFDQRVKAVNSFRALPEAQALAAANKRVGNILAKFDGELPAALNADLFSEDAEKALSLALDTTIADLADVFESKDYTAALSGLAALREVTDNFFDQVMVMADDEEVKKNRLLLLSNLRSLFLRVADISVLQS